MEDFRATLTPFKTAPRFPIKSFLKEFKMNQNFKWIEQSPKCH